ncbi:MAG: insulinase family protein [Candidatus Eremiobacteraeota bacterium]|nr:insulinase family protein [Candidatus Eremiobacteraeota bacterium]MBV8374717.1 insulinase family protein [Candidatus Eremiobacteraeota bacterium]
MRAALLLAFVLLLAAAPSLASVSLQQKGTLPKGGSYVIDPDPTLSAAAVDLWFRAPGAGYDDASPGIARLAATAAAVAPLASGKSLYELVHSLGGALNVQVYPDLVSVGAIVPSAAARRVVAAMTAAYFAPSINDAAVKQAQRDSAVLAVAARYNPDDTLHDLLFKQLFLSGPAHFAPLPDSVAMLTRIPVGDVTAFAKRAFRSENAILTAAGNVDISAIDAVTDGSGGGTMDAPYDSRLAGAPVSATVPGVVDGIGLAWAGPGIGDTKAATALDLVADYLFRDETGVVAKAVGLQKGTTFLNGQFVTLHDPGVMLVTLSGDSTAAAQQIVLDALEKMQRPLDPKTFAAAREAFLYHIASDTDNPQGQADNLGWYTAEGNATYAPGDAAAEYAKTARALDPQYVAGIVARYLKQPVVVHLVTAKASQS